LEFEIEINGSISFFLEKLQSGKVWTRHPVCAGFDVWYSESTITGLSGFGKSSYNAFKILKRWAKKKVILHIRDDIPTQKLRLCLSEHPFGTVKWHHGAHYLL